jgi:3-methyladenine DNA glycosylase/8-oxoguanine DNA glycosylase
MRRSWRGVRLFTIGHSTRSLDELVGLLRGFDVSGVIDVRTIPRSRRHPQFDGDALRASLRARGLRYLDIAELGGLRKARADSPNGAWRNPSFRGYADHMLTEGFEAGLATLRAAIADGTSALLCAEAVPWRCHRSLIADALTARGAHVAHITGAHRASPHRMTSFAHVEGTRVTYPGDPGGALATRAPFHLEATVRLLQRREANLVDVWEDARYLRVLATPEGLALVEVIDHGTVDKPALDHRVIAGRASASIAPTVRRMLGLDVDPRPLHALLEKERALRAIASPLRGMRPPRFASLFETVANVVPFQQVSLDAGVAIVRRLVERFGASLEHDGRRRFAFPEAHDVARARLPSLRACGLSARKAETLRGLARAIDRGELVEAQLAALSSDDAIAQLVALSGIGPWSAALVLLRGLGRLDVFPPGDVGVARKLGAQLDRLVRRFGDRRGYLYFCALGRALLQKGLIHAAPPR